MEIDIHYPTDEDVLELVANILPADRDEILALGYEIEWAIRNSIATSLEVGAIRADGKLAAITGVCQSNTLGERVYPWLVSTPELLRHPRAVVEYSRNILAAWLQVYPHMSNYVDQRHYRAVRWLRWLGAKLRPEPAFGPYARPFYHFTFGDPDVY